MPPLTHSLLPHAHAIQGLSLSPPTCFLSILYGPFGKRHFESLSLPFFIRVEALLWTSLAGKAGLNQTTFLCSSWCCREKKKGRSSETFSFFFLHSRFRFECYTLQSNSIYVFFSACRHLVSQLLHVSICFRLRFFYDLR